MKHLFYIFIFCSFLLGCASGSVIVTGKQREPINPENVIIYTETPSYYEVIGIVTASSDMGWTEQGDLNYAIAELKKQAANVGANGIILESLNTVNSGGVMTAGVYVPITAKSVSGKAIYVP